jgi:ankyrin repeat protein
MTVPCPHCSRSIIIPPPHSGAQQHTPPKADGSIDADAAKHRDEQGKTRLHMITLLPPEQRKTTAESLIAAGADINAHDNRGLTPLHIAVFGKGGDSEIAALLLEHGADINAQDITGVTPLHLATSMCKVADLSLIKMLCDAGARLDIQDRNGMTPGAGAELSFMCDNKEAVITYLRQRGGKGFIR